MRVLLSRFIGKIASLRLKYFSMPLVRIFRLAFKIKDPINIENHQSLNDFFSRKKTEYFLLSKSEGSFCSPAEGVISQYGTIKRLNPRSIKRKIF